MIRVNRPGTIPSILSRRGSAATAAIIKDYSLGQRAFDFDTKIYGAKSVKSALRKARHDKCCYCESKFLHSSYGDVEHYRPKKSVRQGISTNADIGYFWLAYSIDNLLFSCEQCNRTHKRDLFPLKDESVRAKCHLDDLNVEDPLIINPANTDPEQHISFRDEYPYAAKSKLPKAGQRAAQ